MIRKILFLLVITATISCNKPDPNTFIDKIGGYWEIKKVITAQGIIKEYNYNSTIDFIEVKNNTGIRKKLKPQLNGTFISTKDAESFTLTIAQDSLRIYYKTPLATWKETVISAKEEEMIIQNEAGNRYFYSPYKKIDITDGQTTQ